MTDATGYAHVSFTPRDHGGNPGMGESLGIPSTVEEAKEIGEAHAIRLGESPAGLYWRQVAPTSWLLMSGERYTHIRVAWVVPQEKAS